VTKKATFLQVKKTLVCGGQPDCEGLWTRKFVCGPELCKEVQEQEDQEDQEQIGSSNSTRKSEEIE
jgi:hypothetical protein